MNSSDIFAAAFENLRAGVLLLEKSTGLVVEANPAFLRMCGLGRNEVTGRNFWAPPLIADVSAGAEVFEHLRAGGSVAGCGLPLETGDGRRLLLEVSGAELADGVVQLEVRDVTARAGTRMAERIEAQRSLAARVAAEFSDIERALQAAAESRFPGSEQIREGADHAGAIARELMAYCRQVALKTSRVQLNELIDDMQPALEYLLGPDIQLVADLSRDAAPVMADPAQVRRILLKLAANSREAMEHGGKLRIATRNAPADDPALGRTVEPGSYAMLEVCDDGPGFDDESWEHLYEPFFTTKKHGKQGLGLAAVYGIVRQMGGRLWAYSEPGKGVSFRIYLPRAQAEPVALPSGGADSHSRATILLVEQNDGLRTVVANILQKRGYRVLTARAASDALEMMQTEGPHLPTLILNGHAERAEPATATLDKPFELETLLGKVRELLDAVGPRP